MQFHTPVVKLNRVGKALEKRFKHLGIETVQDLLFYFPFRYEDYSKLRNIKDLQEDEQVTIKGKIELIANKRSPRKRTMITEAIVADETEQLKVVWFGQPFITKALKQGDSVYLSGKVSNDMFGLQMTSPAYEKDKSSDTTHTARIVPMYSLTSGITQKQLRFLVNQIIDLADGLEDWLTEDLREKADVMDLGEAVRAIHFPESDDELQHALRRLKFDELYVLQLRGEMLRQSIKKSIATEIKFKEDQIKKFVRKLPFELTKKQKISSWEILQDMEKSEPMNRLLEGDVGSGKTVVAAMAMYNAVLSGHQAIIMAPTEVLAFQHYESLSELFDDLDIEVSLLTRSGAQASRKYKVESIKSLAGRKKEIIKNIVEGKLNIIVGTHALLTDKVEFKDLGLVIVDEQHRFGVEQRKTIREKSGDKNTTPHFLSMTATPIPRSFALTLYGDLDLSIIDEMPANRKPVKTRLVDPHNREKAYEFIKSQVKLGRQVFVVCPLIEKKEEVHSSEFIVRSGDDKKSVLSEYKKLSKQIFPDLKIGFLHGKLKSVEKDETMKKFSGGEIDILVSTSVIEVGVDIPNASVMMIEGAERFGLAQLHQFRGRVGRSEHQSYCFLFTDSDTNKVKERLSFFESENSGFKVAEYDLEQRGPGEVYGFAQSGMKNLKLSTLQDHELIKLARDMARDMDFGKHPSLKDRVEEWESSVHLE
ncbi:MAG: ATP-dependent DNA helicase RecG [Candidatus Magasanikbacteria bacterium]|nr:ATP-dependent DNA helicase RecG [Candidatus Magasanikbacteria bacterium]